MLRRRDFNELNERFPDLQGRLREHSRIYQDDLKQQQKKAVKKISYLEKISDDVVEDMLYSMK